MRKLALALMATSALVFGLGTVANAQSYSRTVSVSPSTPTAGGPYSSTYTNCTAGETITFSQPQSTPATLTATCVATSADSITGTVVGLLFPQQTAGLGNATVTFSAAPTAAGTYTVTASGPTSPVQTAVFTIAAQAATTTVAPAVTPAPTTPGSGLPATGSSGISTTTGIAIGLLVVGAGLFIVAQVRRRTPATTA